MTISVPDEMNPVMGAIIQAELSWALKNGQYVILTPIPASTSPETLEAIKQAFAGVIGEYT